MILWVHFLIKEVIDQKEKRKNGYGVCKDENVGFGQKYDDRKSKRVFAKCLDVTKFTRALKLWSWCLPRDICTIWTVTLVDVAVSQKHIIRHLNMVQMCVHQGSLIRYDIYGAKIL